MAKLKHFTKADVLRIIDRGSLDIMLQFRYVEEYRQIKLQAAWLFWQGIIVTTTYVERALLTKQGENALAVLNGPDDTAAHYLLED